MQIGKLRHRVRVESEIHSSDGAGGEVSIWSADTTSLPAEVLPTGGGKDLEGGTVSIGQQRFKVTLRYRDDLVAAYTKRLVWERAGMPDLPLRIDSIEDADGRRRHMIAFVSAGVPT